MSTISCASDKEAMMSKLSEIAYSPGVEIIGIILILGIIVLSILYCVAPWLHIVRADSPGEDLGE
jgi:hypothetical protein